MSAPTYGSLFAGVGGLDLGFDAAGWQCSFQVEWDEACQGVLARHWPDVPRWGDVQTVHGAELPPVDLIAFGSPCQDLSVAGKRAGLDGHRSGLFFEAARIIREMRHATQSRFPRFALWENVAGALSSNGGADFGAVLDAMEDLGAVAIEWHVLDARWFGVPQRRRRIFLVAVFDPAVDCARPLLPVAPRSGWHPPSGGSPGQVAARGAARGTRKGRGLVADTGIVTSLTAMDGIERADLAHAQAGWLVPALSFDSTFSAQSTVQHDVSPPLKVGTGLGIASPPAVAYRQNGFSQYEQDDVASPLRHHEHKEPGDLVAVPAAAGFKAGQSAAASLGYEVEVAQTLGANMSALEPTVHQGMTVRRLTPVECERLMGWPDDHTRWRADGTEQPDTARYKQCGNGIASPVAEWVARHLANALGAT